MPSNMLAIDSGFPTFTGQESPEQQIRELHNYLFRLREGLQYSLRNLSSDNFSGVAWKDLTEGQKDAVAKELEKIGNVVTEFRGDLDRLTGRVNELSGLTTRVDEAEEAIQGLAEWLTEEDAEVETLKVAIFGEEGSQESGLVAELATVTERLAEICEILLTDQENGVSLGAEGQDLHLKGNVYINGVAYMQGGA